MVILSSFRAKVRVNLQDSCTNAGVKIDGLHVSTGLLSTVVAL